MWFVIGRLWIFLFGVFNVIKLKKLILFCINGEIWVWSLRVDGGGVLSSSFIVIVWVEVLDIFVRLLFGFV